MTSIETPNSTFNISTLENGHFILPPIIVLYSDGSTSNLIIEVGDRLDSSNSTANTNIRIDLNNATPNNPPTSLTTLGSMLADALNHHSRRLNNTPTPANTATTSNLSSPPFNQNSSIPSTTQEGIRGLDFPAFDTSREGVYASEQSNSSDSVDRLMLPIQRALEERQRQRERLQLQSRERRQQLEAQREQRLLLHQQREQQLQEREDQNSRSPSANSQSTTSPVIETEERSRNIILTVNYIYGQGPPQATTQNNNGDVPSLTGSLILHIPSISESNDDNLQVLVRLATSIALRTIATSVNKVDGVTDEAFDKLEVRHTKDLTEGDRQCAICYDNYEANKEEEEEEVEVEVEVEEADKDRGVIISKKRKRDTKDDEELQEQKHRSKLRKTQQGQALQSSATPLNAEPQNSKKNTSSAIHETIYLHIPVTMPCGHTFGRSCLREWLKTNSSCPLCRDKIKPVSSRSTRLENETNITLPNLASVISQSQLLIEDFNSRSMSFIIPDQDSNPNDVQSEEISDPISLPISFPNFNFPSANINRSHGTDVTENESNGNPTEVASVLSVVRGLFDRLIGRQLRQRTGSDSLSHVSSLHTSSNDGNSSPGHGSPDRDVFPRGVNRSRANMLGAIETQLSRRRAIQRRTNSLHPLSSSLTRSQATSNDLLFPLGVESRRTVDGVSTSLIGSSDASNNSSNFIDTPINTDTVDNEEADE